MEFDMPGSFIPGALGFGANQPVIDEHTSARVQMPTAQPVGATAPAGTPAGSSRPMTAGEIAMSKLIFREAVDYSRVKVHNEEYLWFGLQDDNTAMTPDGEMYFNPKRFKEDFSTQDVSDRHWFIHEMVHVWQYQLGYSVWWNGWQRWKLTYQYLLDQESRLGDYDMEQQGDIVADYFALAVLKDSRVVRNASYRNPETILLFMAVLTDFLKDPSDKISLPK
jgi:type VI secretion system secreted protein VgrG